MKGFKGFILFLLKYDSFQEFRDKLIASAPTCIEEKAEMLRAGDNLTDCNRYRYTDYSYI